MFNMEKFARVATAAVAALVLSTTVVGAAVGPARVLETSPIEAPAEDSGRLNA